EVRRAGDGQADPGVRGRAERGAIVMSRPRGTALITALAMSGVTPVLSTPLGARAEVPSVEAISVQPAEFALHGGRARQRLLRTGRNGPCLETDLTAVATYESLDPSVAAVSSGGVVSPRGPGRATVVVRYAGHEQRAWVRVEGADPGPPVDFRTEVVAALG